MRNPLMLAPIFACMAAHGAPGFKQTLPFPAFEAWARGAVLPGMAFKEAKDEAEAYLAVFKAKVGLETLTVKIEGAGKFEGLAVGGSTFTWKGLEAKSLALGANTAMIAVKYGDSKATLSATLTASPKARTQLEMEKVLTSLKSEKILK